MNGWASDPSGRNPGWLLWMNSDPTLAKNWTQLTPGDPPDGFAPDPPNPGWYLRVGGDPANKADWWSDSTVVATPVATGPVLGMDVSNAQGADLGGLIAKASAQHVVIKAYQTIEVQGGRDHAKAQVASAQANGCSVGMYLWLYATIDPHQQVGDTIALAREAGIVLPVLWLDIEPYTDGSLPSVQQIAQAVQACQEAGQRVGIYTGKWVWDRLGNPQDFASLPLWHAEYSGGPALLPVNYGGWTMPSAHQYSDKASDGTELDCDVFDASVV